MTPFHYKVVPIVFGMLVACVVALPKTHRESNVEDDPAVQLRVSPSGGPVPLAKDSEPQSAPSKETAGATSKHELMRREPKREKRRDSMSAKSAVASLAETLTSVASGRATQSAEGHSAPAEVEQDGVVTVVNGVENGDQGTSEELKLEELNEECMKENSVIECEEKYGSYGVKHMYTEEWVNIKRMGWRRQGWMSHPNVQKKKFFDLTLPGSAKSGSYASMMGNDANEDTKNPEMLAELGEMTQNLDIYKQLEMGVRAFDFKVGYSSKTQLIHAGTGSDGSAKSNLIIPIATMMRDMRRFLEENQREVVVLDIKKDLKLSEEHITVINAEESNPERVPGQLIHDAVECELKEMLATYKTLSQLPADQLNENPTVGALTDAGIQVIYFWEGQQVLCTSFTECKKTPGWIPPSTHKSFAFGEPYKLGQRIDSASQAVTGDRAVIEPACQAHSYFYTQDDKPEKLHEKATAFCKDLVTTTKTQMPTCFPHGADLPLPHNPTVWYTLEAYTTPTAQEEKEESQQLRGVKAIYTRGEGVTTRSDVERTNYIMLNWFLKENNQPVFRKPNAIMFEFVSSAYMNLIRIIEVNQDRPECGWALYCKKSGSCWADTLLADKDECKSEKDTEKLLAKHAEGWEDSNIGAYSIFTNNFARTATLVLLGVCACCGLVAVFDFIMKSFKAELPLQEKFDKYVDGEVDEAGAAAGAGISADSGESDGEAP